jgi:RNA polymerase sigma factor (sigma-70 family)
MSQDRMVENLLRQLTPQVLGTIARRHGEFDACEDAVQEALLAASTRWPVDGVPSNPAGWLYSAARHRLIDQIRADLTRRRREETVQRPSAPVEADASTRTRDDTLTLLFLCCDPALGEPAQVALTLRCVAGLTTGQIAAAYLVPEPTIGQRITRAKKRLHDAGPPSRCRHRRTRATGSRSSYASST